MKIGIDARLIQETGVGRYIQNLIINLAKIDDSNEYTLFLPKKFTGQFNRPKNTWKTIYVDVAWHTLREQLAMPNIFNQEKLDLLHVPYFNIPILYTRPYVVTIHDLIVHHFDTGKASTLPYPLYKIRRAGYEIAHIIGLRQAKRIIAVSRYTKTELMNHYGVPSEKIDVIYEGIDDRIIYKKDRGINTNKKFFLYVGNAYPHKNLKKLIDAFSMFLDTLDNKSENSALRLILVGKEDFFYSRLKKELSNLPIYKKIDFRGSVSNYDLSRLYKDAYALFMPSHMEGFGLPPLEALANGTPVIVANIPVFHEILGDAPLYFDPDDVNDLVGKMTIIWKNRSSIVKHLPNPAHLLFKYRWDLAARDTIRCYNNSLS